MRHGRSAACRQAYVVGTATLERVSISVAATGSDATFVERLYRST
jgi:hypothetical protein